jgi:hypothetical protein
LLLERSVSDERGAHAPIRSDLNLIGIRARILQRFNFLRFNAIELRGEDELCFGELAHDSHPAICAIGMNVTSVAMTSGKPKQRSSQWTRLIGLPSR